MLDFTGNFKDVVLPNLEVQINFDKGADFID
jgi:hypothetical protein